MLHHKLVAEIIGSDLLCSHEFDMSCDTCRMRILCLPAPRSTRNLRRPGRHHRASPHTESWARTCTSRTRNSKPCAPSSGAASRPTPPADGWVRITSCHLAGEIFGFSGIGESHYRSTARALEDTAGLRNPVRRAGRPVSQNSRPAVGLFHLMSQRMVEDHELAAQFMHKRPPGSVSRPLLGLSTRAARRGEYNRTHLPMSRTDIGNYLESPWRRYAGRWPGWKNRASSTCKARADDTGPAATARAHLPAKLRPRADCLQVAPTHNRGKPGSGRRSQHPGPDLGCHPAALPFSSDSSTSQIQPVSAPFRPRQNHGW